jgi:hypothetical protein
VQRMKRSIPILSATAALLLLCAAGRGADLTIVNGDVDLTISSASAGQQPDPVMNESCQLRWTTLVTDPTQKIVVSSDLPSPRYTLTLQALNVSAGDGASAGIVPLSTIASDFVVGIPANLPPGDPGECTLRYRASATAAGGTGSDGHTITFTILAQ